jgi:hypothetical protein
MLYKKASLMLNYERKYFYIPATLNGTSIGTKDSKINLIKSQSLMIEIKESTCSTTKDISRWSECSDMNTDEWEEYGKNMARKDHS